MGISTSTGNGYFTILQVIEEKIKTLKPQISIAIENRDTTQLRVHQETIKVLVTDLEMIEVKEHTPLGEKKSKLDKSIVSQYYKITKAVEEIRDKNINHPRTHSKPTNELELIYQDLHGIEVNLSSMLVSNDQSTINKLQETMSEIKKRLTFAEITNESARETQMKLLKKHMDISRTINENLKTGSQSDLSKAQVNYEEIVRNIASGDSLDKDEIKIKFRSLENFIKSIKVDDENILRWKQQLLYNVRQSFSLILEDEQEILNTSMVPPTHKSNRLELDNFHDNWTSLDIDEIDKVLSDIQKSVKEKRQQLVEQTTSVSSLNKNLYHSTPNLSSSKSAASKFRSNLSVDCTDQSLIKAKVLVYNGSTPQIPNVGDQPVVLRNNKLFNNSVNPDDSRSFSKIEEIKTQVNYIKEKFEESEQKEHKNKLESYIQIINDYVCHPNLSIADAAKALFSDIHNMLRNMSHIQEAMDNTSHRRRATIEFSFENIVGIQTAVEEIEKVVTTFQGYKDDTQYNKIMYELSECKIYLLNVEIPPKYDTIQQQKEEIVKKIEVTANNLERRCYCESIELQNTKKISTNLKEKDKFTTKYTTDDVEKQPQIMQQKTTKYQSFPGIISETKCRNEDEEKLINLKDELVKCRLDQHTFIQKEEGNEMEALKNNVEAKISPATQSSRHWSLEQDQEEKIKTKGLGIIEEKFKKCKSEIESIELHKDQSSINKLQDTMSGIKRSGVVRTIEDSTKTSQSQLSKAQINYENIASGNSSHIDEIKVKLYGLQSFINGINECDDNILMGKQQLLNNIRQSFSYILEEEPTNSKFGSLLSIDIVDKQDSDSNLETDLMVNDVENPQEKVVNLKTKLTRAENNNNLLQRNKTCIEEIDDLLERISINNEKAAREYAQRKVRDKELSDLISSIDIELDSVKDGIKSLHITHSNAIYCKLSSRLKALFFKSESIQLPEGSELHYRKIQLLEEMHKYTENLRNHIKESDTPQEILQQSNLIKINVDNYIDEEDDERKSNELRSVQMKAHNIKIRENRRSDQKFRTPIGGYVRFKEEKETPPNDVGCASVHKNVQSNLSRNNGPHNVQNSIATRMAETQEQAGSFMDCESRGIMDRIVPFPWSFRIGTAAKRRPLTRKSSNENTKF